MRSVFIAILVFVGIILVLYLSWLPQPKLGLIWFVPDWLANWTDANENDTIRTGVPFVALGVISGIWLPKSSYSWQKWLVAWMGLVAVVLTAEAGQLLLPNRSFDWKDIAWGAIGASVGMSVARLGRFLKAMFADR